MIQQNFKHLLRLSVYGIVLLPAFAHGQEQAPISTIDWPNTFTGQPDFEYVREDVVKEIKEKKGKNANLYIATFDDLLRKGAVDPFQPQSASDIGRSRYSGDDIAAKYADNNNNVPVTQAFPNMEVNTELDVTLKNGEVVKARLRPGSTVSYKNPETEEDVIVEVEVTPKKEIVERVERKSIQESFEDLFAQNAFLRPSDLQGNGADDASGTQLKGLPTYDPIIAQLPLLPNMSDQARIDLSGFATFLDNILAQASKDTAIELKDINFKRELQRITLQSIVTSPIKYAIINNKRFGKGDRFNVPIKAKTEKKNIGKLIDSYMPEKNTLPADIYSEYVRLKEEAVRQYNERTGVTDENSEGEIHNISVTVKEIERRKVILSVLGQEYPLEINLQL